MGRMLCQIQFQRQQPLKLQQQSLKLQQQSLKLQQQPHSAPPLKRGRGPRHPAPSLWRKKSADSEKEKNPFESLTKEEGGRTPEQEEMRKKRLAVFEEQKRRLMNQ